MFFPDADPIGHRIRLANAAAPDAPQPWFTIVGVAPTVPQIAYSQSPESVVYVSLRGEPVPHRFASIIVRAEGDRASIVSLLREEVRKVDPDLPGYDIQTMDEVRANSRSLQSVLSAMFALLAGIALVLASVGLYAVTAHGVTQRTQEIGIRVALGAQSSQVVGLFVKRTAVQLVIGLLVGLAGTIVVGRLLSAAGAIPRAHRANRSAHSQPRQRAADRGDDGCQCLAGAGRGAGRSCRGVAIGVSEETMVLTKSELIASLHNEVRILLHLVSKVDRTKLDYRPTPK